jgi:hypothetical protein
MMAPEASSRTSGPCRGLRTGDLASRTGGHMGGAGLRAFSRRVAEVRLEPD